MAETFDGGCACGAVRFRMQSGPMFVHCCHCRDCQRQTGSAFVINALIEADRVDVQGHTEGIGVPTDSGRPHTIHRCPSCRIALWSEYGGRPMIRFMRVGTLDDPTLLAPDVHIYARTKLPWVHLAKDARVFDAYYDSRQEWPAASLERLGAVLGKSPG
jgi:hypothetical protein